MTTTEKLARIRRIAQQHNSPAVNVGAIEEAETSDLLATCQLEKARK